MRSVLVVMTGIGFTLGVVFGLLLQLPIDNTLPAESLQNRSSQQSPFRSRRSLSQTGDNQHLESPSSNKETIIAEDLLFSKHDINKSSFQIKKGNVSFTKPNSFLKSKYNSFESNKEQSYNLINALKGSIDVNKNRKLIQARLSNFKPNINNTDDTFSTNNLPHYDFQNDSIVEKDTSKTTQVNDNNSNASVVVSLRINLQKGSTVNKENSESLKLSKGSSVEDADYLASIVTGSAWTPQLESTCPHLFTTDTAEDWRRRVDDMDVVRMEEGCGRMQNRLVYFRDGSKACARYRLNSDQIQGDIFSYYLARVLNVSNIPPTVLARVDSLSSKWRTVHLQLSLAQWADTKLVVLSQHIDGLSPAHIPPEFREEGKRLEPTLTRLGSKSHSELCELVQWSDLIVFDYLTANLDRVINNMFNSQWNDQMMHSPAHNLEQRADGGLVFLDNESGLFHGYRLLEKYFSFHRTLLNSLCVFRQSTAEAIKRLHKSSKIGEELHNLFASNEVLHKHIAGIPEKNIKILQQRLGHVNQQIVDCERLFNR